MITPERTHLHSTESDNDLKIATIKKNNRLWHVKGNVQCLLIESEY